MTKERGKFGVWEGVAASGKTTQLLEFRKNNPEWYLTREPGGTSFGDKVRDAVQGMHDYSIHPYAELLAYSASRANLVHTEIIPRLERGENVACDRYWYSTYAIQGARGVPKP